MITAGLHASPKTLSAQDDELLVDLAVAGNEAAFDALVARYRQPLLLYCSRLLPSDRAEDVVQEALLRTYAVLRSGQSPTRLRPWLFQVAHNAAVDALRSRPPAAAELDAEHGDAGLTDRLIDSRYTTREVLAAVQGLPDRQRDAIVLRELEGRSYDDIGSRLGTSRAAVRQLIVRARQTVRAAAAAFTPAGLVTRFPWLGNSVAGHSAELSAGAGVSAATAQVWVTALVTCTMGGSVVVLSQAADHPASAAKTVDAPTAALSAELMVGALVGSEALKVRRAELRRAREQEQASGPGSAGQRATTEEPSATAETPAEITPPPLSDCGVPAVGTAKRRHARRSCDLSGPLAVGNTGPNDPPVGAPLVPTQGVIEPIGSPPASTPQGARPAEEPVPASPPSAPEPSEDPRDVPQEPGSAQP